MAKKREMQVSVPPVGQASLIIQRGGPREGAGRKRTGETRKLSLTLPESEWLYIDKLLEQDYGPKSIAEYFRLCHRHARYDDPETWGDQGIEPVLDRETMLRLRKIDEHNPS